MSLGAKGGGGGLPSSVLPGDQETRLAQRAAPRTMSIMDRTNTVTDEEYETIMSALDVTAARYEELAQKQPHMVPEQRR